MGQKRHKPKEDDQSERAFYAARMPLVTQVELLQRTRPDANTAVVGGSPTSFAWDGAGGPAGSSEALL